MTKEELKKKAEDSLDKMVTDKGIILGCHEGFCYDEVTDFMAEFAEPREKRIAELEQIISDIQNANCVSCTTLGGMQIKITELEKENARLKVESNFNEKACEGASMMYKDLLKAKELLKGIASAYCSLVKEVNVDVYPPDVYFEAKQFLNENSDTYERIQKAKYNYTD